MEATKPTRLKGSFGKFFNDFRALFIKAFYLAVRNRGQTVAEILLAYAFLGLLLGMRYILDRRYHAAFQIPIGRPLDYLSVNGTGDVLYYYPSKFTIHHREGSIARHHPLTLSFRQHLYAKHHEFSNEWAARSMAGFHQKSFVEHLARSLSTTSDDAFWFQCKWCRILVWRLYPIRHYKLSSPLSISPIWTLARVHRLCQTKFNTRFDYKSTYFDRENWVWLKHFSDLQERSLLLSATAGEDCWERLSMETFPTRLLPRSFSLDML